MSRLLLITTEFPPGPGGIGVHAYQIAKHLSRQGWEVVVVTSQDYASPEEIEAFNAVQDFRVVQLKKISGAVWEAVYRLAVICRSIKTWQPDVLLGSGQRAVWLTALAARLHSRPWAAVGHGFEFGTKVSWERRLNRLFYSQADCAICVSNYTRSRMLGMGIRPLTDAVIPNGADDEWFRPLEDSRVAAFRRRLGLDGKKLLLTVGNVTDRKGQDIVVRALPAVVGSGIDCHYVLAGLPTRKDQLTCLAQELGVAPRLHFLGRVDPETLVEAYNACDVYVMTSRHSRTGDFEGYGIAAVEAALCGKPAVVSQGCGLEEAILPGETGLLVPEDDPQATAGVVTLLLKDGDLRQRLGSYGRKRALQEQTWGQCALHYAQVLESIIRKNQDTK